MITDSWLRDQHDPLNPAKAGYLGSERDGDYAQYTNLRHLIYRDLEFHGATFVVPEVFANIVRYIEQDRIKALVAKTFPLRDLGVAQAEFIKKRHTGNLVIVI